VPIPSRMTPGLGRLQRATKQVITARRTVDVIVRSMNDAVDAVNRDPTNIYAVQNAVTEGIQQAQSSKNALANIKKLKRAFIAINATTQFNQLIQQKAALDKAEREAKPDGADLPRTIAEVMAANRLQLGQGIQGGGAIDGQILHIATTYVNVEFDRLVYKADQQDDIDAALGLPEGMEELNRAVYYALLSKLLTKNTDRTNDMESQGLLQTLRTHQEVANALSGNEKLLFKIVINKLAEPDNIQKRDVKAALDPPEEEPDPVALASVLLGAQGPKPSQKKLKKLQVVTNAQIQKLEKKLRDVRRKNKWESLRSQLNIAKETLNLLEKWDYFLGRGSLGRAYWASSPQRGADYDSADELDVAPTYDPDLATTETPPYY